MVQPIYTTGSDQIGVELLWHRYFLSRISAVFHRFQSGEWAIDNRLLLVFQSGESAIDNRLVLVFETQWMNDKVISLLTFAYMQFVVNVSSVCGYLSPMLQCYRSMPQNVHLETTIIYLRAICRGRVLRNQLFRLSVRINMANFVLSWWWQ